MDPERLIAHIAGQVSALQANQRSYNRTLEVLRGRPLPSPPFLNTNEGLLGRLDDIEDQLQTLANQRAEPGIPSEGPDTPSGPPSSPQSTLDSFRSHASSRQHHSTLPPTGFEPDFSRTLGAPYERHLPSPYLPDGGNSSRPFDSLVVQAPPPLVPFIYRPRNTRPRSPSITPIDSVLPRVLSPVPLPLPPRRQRRRRAVRPQAEEAPRTQMAPIHPQEVVVRDSDPENDADIQLAIENMRRVRFARMDRNFEQDDRGYTPHAGRNVHNVSGSDGLREGRQWHGDSRTRTSTTPLTQQQENTGSIPPAQTNPEPTTRRLPPERPPSSVDAHLSQYNYHREPSGWYHHQAQPPPSPVPNIVQLPQEVFQPIMEILRDIRVSQLKSVDQQREIAGYAYRVNDWLERDANHRQSNFRGVVARLDELETELHGRPGT